jgi:hypothetical protein
MPSTLLMETIDYARHILGGEEYEWRRLQNCIRKCNDSK